VKFLLRAGLLVLLFLAANARADLIVTGGNATVAPNSTVSFPFYITSDGPTDNLQSFQLQLQITTLTGTSFLQFTSAQADPYANTTYVFYGNSFGQDFALPFYGDPYTTNTPNDSIVGGDSTNDDTNVTITSSTEYFLGLVQVQSANGATPGDSFQIALVPSAGSVSSSTYFQDADGDYNPFTSTPGVVTVVPVPEPSPFAFASLGLLAIGARGVRKLRLGIKDGSV
jgi:hypothetical protein